MFLPARNIEKVLESLGYDPKESKIDDSTWGVVKGSAIVLINVIEGELFAVHSPMADIPKNNLVGLYRHLLESNFTETMQSRFFIQDNVIHLGTLRPLQGLDREEMESIIAEIAVLSDKFDDYLKSEFGAKLITERKRFLR